MAVLLSTDTGRCDAHCHNATTPECTCCCAGRYHGTGVAARGLVLAEVDAGRADGVTSEGRQGLLF